MEDRPLSNGGSHCLLMKSSEAMWRIDRSAMGVAIKCLLMKSSEAMWRIDRSAMGVAIACS